MTEEKVHASIAEMAPHHGASPERESRINEAGDAKEAVNGKSQFSQISRI